MIKKNISQDSFIYGTMKTFDVSGQKDVLEKKFKEVYKDRIQELYEEFLIEETVERMAADYPALKMKIADSSLSNRSKNTLAAENVTTVSDLVLFSPKELMLFRNMGASSVKEIEDFVKSIGL